MHIDPTPTERQLLHTIRIQADELARLIHQASQMGYIINFNINGSIGACDVFNVFKTVPVDMKSGAN